MSSEICEIIPCGKRALIGISTCDVCCKRLCGEHYDDISVHVCSITEDLWLERIFAAGQEERYALIAQIDVNALAAEAASLRPGHTCTGPDQHTINLPEILFGAGCNLHLPLTFDDGVGWLVRMRRRRPMAPSNTALRMNMMSELATLKVLRAAGVLVPETWESPKSHDTNLIYIFEEFIAGKPNKQLGRIKKMEVNETTLGSLRHIAKWFISLSSLSFTQTGSLHRSSNADVHLVGPAINRWPSSDISPFYAGPYPTAKARYLSTIDHMLQQARDGIKYPPSQSLLGYLALLEARSLVEQCEGLEDGEYFIKHGEDKADIFLVDQGGSLTGVIDWEWSSITCKDDAFAAPHGLLNQDYNHGSNDLCPFEKVLVAEYEAANRPDLAEAIRNGKRYQRLADILTRSRLHSAQLERPAPLLSGSHGWHHRRAYHG